MSERGSAAEPSVIRIFAYPGYKGAYAGGFELSWFFGFLRRSVCVELVELVESVELMELVELVEPVELVELVSL